MRDFCAGEIAERNIVYVTLKTENVMPLSLATSSERLTESSGEKHAVMRKLLRKSAEGSRN